VEPKATPRWSSASPLPLRSQMLGIRTEVELMCAHDHLASFGTICGEMFRLNWRPSFPTATILY
jgi:hypothetical protein